MNDQNNQNPTTPPADNPMAQVPPVGSVAPADTTAAPAQVSTEQFTPAAMPSSEPSVVQAPQAETPVMGTEVPATVPGQTVEQPAQATETPANGVPGGMPPVQQ